MNTEEDQLCLKIHGVKYFEQLDNDSDNSSCKSDFDEEYELNKPPPIRFDPIWHKITVISNAVENDKQNLRDHQKFNSTEQTTSTMMKDQGESVSEKKRPKFKWQEVKQFRKQKKIDEQIQATQKSERAVAEEKRKKKMDEDVEARQKSEVDLERKAIINVATEKSKRKRGKKLAKTEQQQVVMEQAEKVIKNTKRDKFTWQEIKQQKLRKTVEEAKMEAKKPEELIAKLQQDCEKICNSEKCDEKDADKTTECEERETKVTENVTTEKQRIDVKEPKQENKTKMRAFKWQEVKQKRKEEKLKQRIAQEASKSTENTAEKETEEDKPETLSRRKLKRLKKRLAEEAKIKADSKRDSRKNSSTDPIHMCASLIISELNNVFRKFLCAMKFFENDVRQEFIPHSINFVLMDGRLITVSGVSNSIFWRLKDALDEISIYHFIIFFEMTKSFSLRKNISYLRKVLNDHRAQLLTNGYIYMLNKQKELFNL